MKWFRARIKAGTRLALLALAVQFVLSFGHVHAAALAAPGINAATAPSTAQRPDQAKPAAATLPAGQTQPTPDQPNDNHHDNYCAICAVMALAGSLIASGPVILLVPEAYQILSRTTDAEFLHIAAPHGVSQPRAPPAS